MQIDPPRLSLLWHPQWEEPSHQNLAGVGTGCGGGPGPSSYVLSKSLLLLEPQSVKTRGFYSNGGPSLLQLR